MQMSAGAGDAAPKLHIRQMQLEGCITSAALHAEKLFYVNTRQLSAAALPACTGPLQKQNIILGGAWTELQPTALGCPALALDVATPLACSAVGGGRAELQSKLGEAHTAGLAARLLVYWPDGLLTQIPAPSAADMQSLRPARSPATDLKVWHSASE